MEANFEAVIFDLDGVLTRTADLHARAWKAAFDEFLDACSNGEGFEPFDIETDYKEHVDGKPRYDGARSFLQSRGIELPEGHPKDSPSMETVCGVGNRKNELFQELLKEEGAKCFEDAVEQARHWRDQGLKTAIVTASRNGAEIIRSTGLEEFFEVSIDGAVAAELDIAGKPAPDIFLEAARQLGVAPKKTVVVEDAISGVKAGRAGNFGFVVGVDREQASQDQDKSSQLQAHGADLVVRDLRDVDLERLQDFENGKIHSDREFHPWTLVYRTYRPEEQPLREALCALGNGHLVTRGAFEEERAAGVHYPGTYVAGGYNRLESEVAGRIIENEDLVNWPNWLPLSFRPEGGPWFHLDQVEVKHFELRLDLKTGTLVREVEFCDEEGREFHLTSSRLVHIARPHMAAIRWTLKALNWSGKLEIRSALDGAVINDNVKRYRGLSNRHLTGHRTGWESDDAMVLSVRTNQSGVQMSQVARTRVYQDGVPVATERVNKDDGQSIAQHLLVACEKQKALTVEKIVAIRTSYDLAISEPETAACEDIRQAGRFEDLFRSHRTQWRHLWSISDIELHNGDVETQLILRLHIFHLMQSTSLHTIDRDVGVPARGWHGEAYRGHVFWDELFIFPLLMLRLPELARSLLMYRYRRLDRARSLAREAGFQGAMYPWQSGSDGREESQVLHLNPKSGRWLDDTTHLQRHVNAAIAYNVWEYYEATGDIQFLAYYGAEMILEIARFWASLATFDAERERYVINGVVGPDEFHTNDPNTEQPGLNNNTYTNVMAAWVLRCACRVLGLLDEERRGKLREKLELLDEELIRWADVSQKLFIPFLDDGVISQFEGYDRLAEFEWTRYRKEHGEALRLDRILEAEGDDVNRYKASKQADVLMLFYLFSTPELEELFSHMGYEFDEGLMERCIDYYMERTAHGSTLSQIVHSWVLARRDREKAWTFWQQALHSDIEDIQGGTTPEGIHLGAMAGTVDLIYRGHTGLVVDADTLWFDPQLPPELSDVKMRIRYRGHWLTVLITQTSFTLSFDRGHLPAVQLGFRGKVFEMEQGETRSFQL